MLPDMALYSIVKSTTFNGIGLPDIAIIRQGKKVETVKRFGYKDYKGRQILRSARKKRLWVDMQVRPVRMKESRSVAPSSPRGLGYTPSIILGQRGSDCIHTSRSLHADRPFAARN